jgi:hypothetical protein
VKVVSSLARVSVASGPVVPRVVLPSVNLVMRTVSVSSGSMVASRTTSTGKTAESFPAGMTTVPESCTKSKAGVAVPPFRV